MPKKKSISNSRKKRTVTKSKMSQSRKLSNEKTRVAFQELIFLLKNMRMQTREIAHNISIRLQSDISQSMDDIQEVMDNKNLIESIDHSYLQRNMNSKIKSLRIKPDKGRLKDLKRISLLLKTIRRYCDSFEN